MTVTVGTTSSLVVRATRMAECSGDDVKSRGFHVRHAVVAAAAAGVDAAPRLLHVSHAAFHLPCCLLRWVEVDPGRDRCRVTSSVLRAWRGRAKPTGREGLRRAGDDGSSRAGLLRNIAVAFEYLLGGDVGTAIEQGRVGQDGLEILWDL